MIFLRYDQIDDDSSQATVATKNAPVLFFLLFKTLLIPLLQLVMIVSCANLPLLDIMVDVEVFGVSRTKRKVIDYLAIHIN